MAKWTIDSSTLTDIADSVRNKRGISTSIKVSSLADEIDLIEGGSLLRDKIIIPDKFNTGCHGKLEKFVVGGSLDTSGIVWRDNATCIDLNKSASVSNLHDDDVIVFENLDFTNYESFYIMNAGAYQTSKAYYKDNLRFVFKNCLLNWFRQPYVFKDDVNISFEFYNCTFNRINGSNCIIDRCLIGNVTFFLGMNNPVFVISGDAVNPIGKMILANSYIMDIEGKQTTAGSGHIDGLQVIASVNVQHLHMFNCRFECFDMPYSASQGNWSYSVFWQGKVTDSSMRYCIFHGGGVYGTSIGKQENQTFEGNLVSGEYHADSASSPESQWTKACYPDDGLYQMSDGWADYIRHLLVSSVWVEDGKIKIAYSNDMDSVRTMRIVTDTEKTYTVSVPACPIRNTAVSAGITKWADLPFDLITEIDALGVSSISIYDGETLVRTFAVDNASTSPIVLARTVVPKTGTWQFKTTPTKGYIILGKDDDTTDSAQFVRMVNGYGYPVVLNSIPKNLNLNISSDADDTDTTYPSGSVSVFPNGGKTIDLYKYIVDNPELGEIALHGEAEDQLWSSTKLTGDVLDTMFATYTAGGGQKTKTELQTAIIIKYAETDVAQGAVRITDNRDILESGIGNYAYTIGRWGGDSDFVVDGITVGSTSDCPSDDSAIIELVRQMDFMGDGLLTWNTSNDIQNPYSIYRNSSGLAPSEIGDMCERAFEYKCCIDCFQHYYLSSPEQWVNFKNAMDTLKSYVDQGKIEVVTRKHYYELGEFVEHPIVGIGLTVAELHYPTGTTLTDADFTCTYTLDNGTTGTCASDRILDYSNVDTTTEGTYTATLEYRGKKATCSVVISNSPPTHYLLENWSYHDTTDLTSNNNYAPLDADIAYEAGKSYRIQFHFKATATTQYGTHYIIFYAPRNGNYSGYRTTTEYQLNTETGTFEGDVTIDLNVTQSTNIGNLFGVSKQINTAVSEWWVTAAYVYEIEAE